MKKNYNFSVDSDEIEVLLKKGNVKILASDIEGISINRYSPPFKDLYKLLCQMACFVVHKADSNFCKDITIIKIKIKNDESFDKLKNKGIYYNLFNLRKFSFKKEENCLYLYEIMYDSVSEEDINIIKNFKLKN